MGDQEGAIVKVVPDISEFDQAQWDSCANPDPETYDPFVSFTFLNILEQSGAVSDKTGWQPQHLGLLDDHGNLSACMPCYLKSHSQGEYVFDHAWADAYERAGGDYYPKLQCAVPFTPVPGRRFLTRPGLDADLCEKMLATGAIELADRLGVSSFHATFVDEAAWQRLGLAGFLRRIDQQFHWTNENYETFDDFLATLSSRKRKVIRKERATAVRSGLEIVQLSGDDITEDHWDLFYKFYLDTGARKWGRPYLNRTFFSLLGEQMADQCLLILAQRDGQVVAGALNITGGDCLYGRYWGAIEHHPCLHFEICYYQAIDYAIANRLPRVEAGAQGEHKLARGYLPTTTYSLHWFADPEMRAAVEHYLQQERRHISHAKDLLTDYAPYKKTCD